MPQINFGEIAALSYVDFAVKYLLRMIKFYLKIAESSLNFWNLRNGLALPTTNLWLKSRLIRPISYLFLTLC